MDKTVEHTSRVGIAAGLSTTMASWGVSDWMAVFGFAVALIGLGVNAWAVVRRDRREKAEHAAKMEATSGTPVAVEDRT